jgi:Xaa-Pro aminopeptidase
MNVFRERRAELARLMAPGSALILFSHPERIRNDDVHFPFRQDSNFYYLTGFEEPESALVFRPGQKPETTLFVRAKDLERETWDGFRYGPEAAAKEFGLGRGELISDFDSRVGELLKSCQQIHYRHRLSGEADRRLPEILAATRRAQGKSALGYLTVLDANQLLGEMRLRKGAADIVALRKACEITAMAHINAMRATRPGLNERQIQGLLLASFLKEGAAREGYNCIVASGASATTLHYNFNDQALKAGDLLLIDAGAEYDYFTGDITRTFPVSGRFSAAQREVYEAVLRVQRAILSMIRPGLAFKELQELAIRGLTEEMIGLGLLKGSVDSLIESGAYRRYYMHGVSHWLGMDVHDAGAYVSAGQSRPLEVGMAFTVEPGLYIRHNDDQAPERLRGIGVRIEDDVLVTPTGREVLTAKAPTDVADIESVVGSGLSLQF